MNSPHTGPAAAQCDPEQAIQRPYGRPGALAFEHGELLSEGEDFQCRFSAREKENADSGEEGADEGDHECLCNIPKCRFTR